MKLKLAVLALFVPWLAYADDTLVLKQSTAGSTNQASDQFGQALAVGDFDGDGHEDLAISVPYDDQGGFDIGMVVVFYSDGGGLDPDDFEKFTQTSVTGASNVSYDRFGYSLAAGDLDGDGFDDLAVGIPFKEVASIAHAGAVAVMYGSSAGLLPSRTEFVTQTSIGYTNTDEDQFGYALTIADFNGDNHDDLGVAIPNEDSAGIVDSGRVVVMYGSAAGVLPPSIERIDQEVLSGSASDPHDRFGRVLASGDLDGDGDDELIVGTPYEDAGSIEDAGMVGVFKGSTAGLLPADSLAYFEVGGQATEAGDRFGFAVAVGDFNGDGFGDVAASAPYESLTANGDGMILILYGESGSHPSTWTETVTQLSAYGSREDFDTAGFSLAAGDFDGDGFSDLAAGVPFEDEGDLTENGAVLAHFGSAAGLLPARSYWYSESYSGGVEQDYDRFGYTLATGDFNGDGKWSIAAGSPYEDVATVQNAGSVFVRTIEPALPEVTAETAIVIDRPSGRVLGVKFPDRLRATASTTKMMTMLLAAEALAAGDISLGATVTIRSGIYDESPFEAGDLAVNDTISLRDLLHLMMLESNNGAATAVGMYVGGSRAAFLTMMNQRAADLGLDNTSYVSVSGRDPEDFVPGCSNDEFDNPDCAHYSTARDLAALARFALDVPFFATIVGRPGWTTNTWRRPVTIGGNPQPPLVMDRTLSNTNNLLAGGYPGAYGVKTGTTDQAGSNLVSAANDGTYDVIAVVLGSDDNGMPTGDRYSDSATVLTFGLANAPLPYFPNYP